MLNVVVHIHQATDYLCVIRNVSIAMDSLFDDAGCYGEVHHVHGLVTVHLRVNQAR